MLFVSRISLILIGLLALVLTVACKSPGLSSGVAQGAQCASGECIPQELVLCGAPRAVCYWTDLEGLTDARDPMLGRAASERCVLFTVRRAIGRFACGVSERSSQEVTVRMTGTTTRHLVHLSVEGRFFLELIPPTAPSGVTRINY